MQDQPQPNMNPTSKQRIALLDLARGVAMVAMTIFHFSWDLEFYGYAHQGMTSELGWKLFARSIAASFLLIVGISFMIAHKDGVRWPSFWRRLAMVGSAAALISVATYFTTPDRFVFFGILHQIAAASLIALLFARLPAALIVSAGIAFIALPYVFRNDIFLAPYFWWAGLAPYDPPSNDYVPVFPWTGFVLVGMALGKISVQTGIVEPLSKIRLDNRSPGKILSFLGQHSLIYYLVHQPIMMGALYLVTLIAPPPAIDKTTLFIPQCVVGCESEREKAFCERFCGCVRLEMEKQSIFQEVLAGKRNVSSDPIVLDIAAVCTGDAEE
jgi:uncharacterized membrane protein